MKRKLLYISIITLMLVLIILPFLISSDVQDSLVVVASLVSGFASLITLIIAFILFDKHGLKKDFIKTQTDVVLDQIESIKTARLMIRSKDKFLQFFPSKSRLEDYEMFYSDKLVFSKRYWQYINEIFLFS